MSRYFWRSIAAALASVIAKMLIKKIQEGGKEDSPAKDNSSKASAKPKA